MKVSLSALLVVAAVAAGSPTKDNIQGISAEGPNAPDSRIFFGHEATPGQFPYHAGLTGVGCGAVLIHPKWALTAAHCTRSHEGLNNPYGIFLGAHNYQIQETTRQDINVLRVHNNPYDSYDISLLELEEEADLNDFVQVVHPATGKNDFAGDTAVATGWGANNMGSSVLNYVDLLVQAPGSTCGDQQSFHLMTKGKDNPQANPCSGDSGGPLVSRSTGELIGIVNFGYGCDNPAGAGFARVSFHIDWIEYVTGIDFHAAKAQK